MVYCFVQSLYKFFQENQYPDRAMKEKIAEELGITSRQVILCLIAVPFGVSIYVSKKKRKKEKENCCTSGWQVHIYLTKCSLLSR